MKRILRTPRLEGFSKATVLVSVFATALFAAVLLAIPGAALAACTGPGAPTNTDTRCLTAIQIPGNPLRSFDISWVNPDRAEYYLAERSNAAIVVIDTRHLTFKRLIGGFVGIKNNVNGTVNNNISGPDGVVTRGRWLYAGDGDSTLKVIDLDAPNASAIKQTIKTGGTTRVDEMALNTGGTLLLAANNAEDPPFGTLFSANGNAGTSATSIIARIVIDNAIVPKGEGLSIEQPVWEPRTQRFYTSVPQIANNPSGCTFGGPTFCQGGLLIVDPNNLPASTSTVVIDGKSVPVVVIKAFDAATNTGVFKLTDCGPNGATVGPHANLLLGCTPQNVPTNRSTLVINAVSKNFANIGNITGSDEVWFNEGDGRYYTASNRACGKPGGCPAPDGGAVLGVIDAETNLLIEKIPQGQNSHSVAADSKRNLIFIPQVGPTSNPAVGIGGDTTPVGQGICGSDNGCVAVYQHDVDRDEDGGDHDRDRGDRDHDRGGHDRDR